MNETQSSTSPPQVEIADLTALFHRLNSVIPEDQNVLSVAPDDSVVDALRKLKEFNFAQLPVVVGKEVLGLFSYRSFANAVVGNGTSTNGKKALEPSAMLVEDCLEKPIFARVTDEFTDLFDNIDRCDAVLVGEPNRLQGIVTAMDILRYLYAVASPFVLIAEVELALRALIEMAVDASTLSACAAESLTAKYAAGKLPTKLHDMTFNDYIQIVSHGRNWIYFHPVLGGDRGRTRARLEQIRDIRNVIFHFKRDIALDEFETLAAGRDWMLLKARAAQARRTGAE